MLDGNIFVAHSLCLVFRLDKCLVQILSDIRLSALYLRIFIYKLFDTVFEILSVNLHFLYQLKYKAVILRKKIIKQVFLLYLLIAEVVGAFLKLLNRLYGLLRKFTYVHLCSSNCYVSFLSKCPEQNPGHFKFLCLRLIQ